MSTWLRARHQANGDRRCGQGPGLAVGTAAVLFLHSVPDGGSDIMLEAACMLAGAVVGAWPPPARSNRRGTRISRRESRTAPAANTIAASVTTTTTLAASMVIPIFSITSLKAISLPTGLPVRRWRGYHWRLNTATVGDQPVAAVQPYLRSRCRAGRR
jgi:hypothetical protein